MYPTKINLQVSQKVLCCHWLLSIMKYKDRSISNVFLVWRLEKFVLLLERKFNSHQRIKPHHNILQRERKWVPIWLTFENHTLLLVSYVIIHVVFTTVKLLECGTFDLNEVFNKLNIRSKTFESLRILRVFKLGLI